MGLKRTLFYFFVFSVLAMLMSFCGKKPSDMPMPFFGSLKISAKAGTENADSMSVTIDNLNKGTIPNGHIFFQIEAGTHQVVVSKIDPESPIDFTSTPKLVAIHADETTEVELNLTKLAPNFSLKNLNNQDVVLENYHGKVVLLVFFSHT